MDARGGGDGDHQDIRLYVFVCRALKAHLEAAGFSSAMAEAGVLPAALSAEQKAVSAQVETALELAVLPGMSLIPSNPAACSEVRARNTGARSFVRAVPN